MKISMEELKVIEQLLSNRMNAGYDPNVEKLLSKVRKEIDDRQNNLDKTMEWIGKWNNTA